MLMLAETAENNANACASATITNPEAGDPVSVYNLSAQEDHQKIVSFTFYFLERKESRSKIIKEMERNIPRARTEPSPAKTKIRVETNSANEALNESGWMASSALPNAYVLVDMAG